MNNEIQEDESAPPADPIVVGGTYIHWKNGREYVVQSVAMGNSIPLVGVDVVVYRPADAAPGDRDYARTRADFTALVVDDAGEVVRRFRLKPKEVPPADDPYPELVRVRVRHYCEVDGYFVVERAKWRASSSEERTRGIEEFIGGGDLYVFEEPAAPGDRIGDQVYDDGEGLFEEGEEEDDG